MKHLEYKGYTGSIEYSATDNILYGKALGIKSLLSYKGGTGAELAQDFKSVIEEYLQECNEEGTVPEKAFKGSFNVRIPADLHRDAYIQAMNEKKNLNQFVTEAIREAAYGGNK